MAIEGKARKNFFQQAILSLVPQILQNRDFHTPNSSILPLSQKLTRFLDSHLTSADTITENDFRFPTLLQEKLQQTAIVNWLQQETGLSSWGKILELCNHLDTLTVENRPISKTIVISRTESPHVQRSADQRINLGDPNVDRIIAFVGANPSTFIKVNPDLDFIGYRAIEPVEEGRAHLSKLLPDSLVPLASNLEATDQEEFFVVRTIHGDILIGRGKGLIATRLRHRWKVIDAEHLSHTLSSLVGDQLTHGMLTGVLFQVAIDHAIHRHGTLIVVDDEAAFAAYTRGGIRKRTPSQLAQILPPDSFCSPGVDRTEIKRLLELSAIDGAVLMDRSGEVHACGAIVIPESHSSPEGSRTIAARSAALAGGVAWKVSADGGLNIYFQKKEIGPGIHEIRL